MEIIYAWDHFACTTPKRSRGHKSCRRDIRPSTVAVDPLVKWSRRWAVVKLQGRHSVYHGKRFERFRSNNVDSIGTYVSLMSYRDRSTPGNVTVGWLMIGVWVRHSVLCDSEERYSSYSLLKVPVCAFLYEKLRRRFSFALARGGPSAIVPWQLRRALKRQYFLKWLRREALSHLTGEFPYLPIVFRHASRIRGQRSVQGRHCFA